MFLKLRKNKQKKNLGYFTPHLNLLESLLSQRFLFHKLCAFNIPKEQSRSPVLLLARTHISLTSFFCLFCFSFLNFTQQPCPRGDVSVDTGGSPVRCGSALCQTHWRQAGGRQRAVLLGPHKRPLVGWGLRNCDRRLSGPAHTLRRMTERREGEKEKRILTSGSPDGVHGGALLL